MDDSAASPRRKRWWTPLASSALYLVVAGTALHVLGVGGYRGGFWLAAAILLAGPAAAWFWMGRSYGGRAAWVAAFAAIALAVSGWLLDHAPESHGRLAADISRVVPPFSTRVESHNSGHSWCRPTCPQVVSVYRAPDTAPFAALFNVAALMNRRGWLADLVVVGQRHPVQYLKVAAPRFFADVRVASEPGHLRLTFTFRARRTKAARPGPVHSDSTSSAITR